MVEQSVVVQKESGLHARPAASFVQMANKFQAEIQILKGDKSANAKSILGLLSLAVTKNTAVTLRCEGADEQAALESLSAYLNSPEE